MDSEKNRSAKLQYFAALNSRDLNAIDTLFHPDYVLHIPGSPDIEGPETLKEMVGGTFAALSEVSATAEDMVAEGDKVSTRWTITAVHSGEFMGIPPTNRRITMNGIIIDRFKDGRVVEAWESFDLHGLMAQMSENSGAG